MTAGFEGFDRISITGVSAFGYHGVLPQERKNGQIFVVDIVLHADLRKAGKTDDLNDTFDYAEVAQLAVDSVTRDPLNLIEALAQRIADAILARYADGNRLSIVEVTVRKPNAPIPLPFKDVAVSIVRVQ